AISFTSRNFSPSSFSFRFSPRHSSLASGCGCSRRYLHRRSWAIFTITSSRTNDCFSPATSAGCATPSAVVHSTVYCSPADCFFSWCASSAGPGRNRGSHQRARLRAAPGRTASGLQSAEEDRAHRRCLDILRNDLHLARAGPFLGSDAILFEPVRDRVGSRNTTARLDGRLEKWKCDVSRISSRRYNRSSKRPALAAS